MNMPTTTHTQDDLLPMLKAPRLNPDWYADSPETILDPGRRIIDAHFHFTDHWAGYGLNEQLADVEAGHRVEATVFIQCGWNYRATGPEPLKPVGETEAVTRIAEQALAQGARAEIAAAIVGHADLTMGAAVEDVLVAHQEAANGRFRGIRCAAARSEAFRFGVLPRPERQLFADPNFRRGLQQLAKHELAFDAWIYHTQIQEVVDLARAVPEVPIVLDHLGGILGVFEHAQRRREVFAEWQRSVRQLADCPNVFVKIGGYAIAISGYHFEQYLTPPSSQLLAELWRPTAEFVIETFGAERCMFESNFPVDRAAGHYATVWNAFKLIAQSASESEKERLFSGTAAQVYRISLKT
ncbi:MULTISPECIES: amidohydrolase family protein [unclassified Pseudomonas]|uniref:amidohydrolase family protein n=1 Tax=unclassified Pseudomonas TaxID=196821 RepID=UPI002114515D|nr:MULTISPECIES: amidohydrolase family protein [unclassified Pseudomonas]